MTSLKETMKFWGHYQEHGHCWAPVLVQDEHPLARAQEIAAAEAEAARAASVRRDIVPRDGSSRRMLMGLAAGLTTPEGKPRALPMEFVDPIPCKESPAVRGAAVHHGSPDEYRWIDRAMSRLYRANRMRALIVREEYAGARGSQKKKAAAVSAAYGAELTVWQYRKELEKGLAFLEASRP